MPRPLRIEFPNAWYHVMNRGAGYRAIFLNDDHRKLFIALLAEINERFDVECHAYCLMDNHYHLLIRTPKGNLSRAMRHLNGLYTQRYNRLQKTDGPLFRGRYKAILVEEDGYVLQVNRYIHRNPIEAKLCSSADKYPWSSAIYYMSTERKPEFLTTNFVLSYFGKQKSKMLNGYIQYVNNSDASELKDFYNKRNTPAMLGDVAFKNKYLDELHNDYLQEVKADYRRTFHFSSMDEIVNRVSHYFNVSTDDILIVRRGRRNTPRMVAIYGSHRWAGKTLKEIANFFHIKSHSSVSTTVKKVEDETLSVAAIKRAVKHLREVAVKH